MSKDQLDRFGKFSKEMYSKVKDVFTKNPNGYCKNFMNYNYRLLYLLLFNKNDYH